MILSVHVLQALYVINNTLLQRNFTANRATKADICFIESIPQISKIAAIGHFTVMDGSEVEGDLVLIQTFLLYYVNQVILMLTSIFQEQRP